MLILTAIILGIVEGLTEFLPVSSTGHLILAGNLLGFTGVKADTFEVVIQLGAILAIVWLYRQRFVRLFKPAAQYRNPAGRPEAMAASGGGLQGRRGIGLLFLTTLPALLAGALLHDFIKDKLFQPLTVAIGLAVGGLALIVFERFKHAGHTTNPDAITPRQALAVGLFQLLALWPGVSRSASTIVGGMLLGMDRKTSVEYSFLIAVPVMIAASGFDLLKSLDSLQAADIPLFVTGFVTAFVAALLAVTYFVKFVQRFGFSAFGYYRIALAGLVLLFLAN